MGEKKNYRVEFTMRSRRVHQMLLSSKDFKELRAVMAKGWEGFIDFESIIINLKEVEAIECKEDYKIVIGGESGKGGLRNVESYI